MTMGVRNRNFTAVLKTKLTKDQLVILKLNRTMRLRQVAAVKFSR